MADFMVRIPRVSVAISEATLTEFLLPEGSFVSEGDPLFVIETEKVSTEIPAGASGRVHWSGTLNATYDIGAEIGMIQPGT
jgi:pyruvate/2-oxoglutarate dehydrogenase complex dihydrolipoamide acyltransferase (E2) component